MSKLRYPFRRNAAIIGAASILAALGIGGVVTAQADQGSTGQQQSQVGDGDGEQNDATEVESDAEVNDDATDQGPDADPNEPGHQDASDEADSPITGADLDKATKAALAETGGGTVTETEAGDEESAYQVEVTMPDGSKIDVQLDKSFAVVGSTTEQAGE